MHCFHQTNSSNVPREKFFVCNLLDRALYKDGYPPAKSTSGVHQHISRTKFVITEDTIKIICKFIKDYKKPPLEAMAIYSVCRYYKTAQEEFHPLHWFVVNVIYSISSENSVLKSFCQLIRVWRNRMNFCFDSTKNVIDNAS